MTVPGWASDQGTLARELRLHGHGSHAGERVNVYMHPECIGHGIVFRRMRGGQQLVLLPAFAALCLGQSLCMTLQNVDGWHVRTVEYLLAALLTCQIDHATVEIDAEKVPILDDSAQSWLQTTEAYGRLPPDASGRSLRALETVVVEDGGVHRTITEPADHYVTSVTNGLKGFDKMNWQGIIDPVLFISDITPSRLYSRLRWAVSTILFGYLRGQPILCDAEPSCVVTIIGSGMIGDIRLPVEFMRHRVLDLIDDLALPGVPLLGKVTALRPGHGMSYRLCAALLVQPSVWEWAYPTH